MIIGVNLTSGYAESASNPYNTASVTLSAGRLILVSLVADGGFVTSLTTVGGPTFTQVGSDVTQLGIKISVWSAVPASDFTGVVSIHTNTPLTDLFWSIDTFSGVQTSNPIRQIGSFNPVSATSASVTLPGVLPNNATYGACGRLYSTGTITNGALYTKLAFQNDASFTVDFCVEYASPAASVVDFTWDSSSAYPAEIALEIAAPPPSSTGLASCEW